MNLTKFYLAKSNRANPDVVSRVRQALSKFPIQIVEYTGGQFSHNPMMKCEQLVVIPDLVDNDIIIGKGLYEQITKFGDDKGYEYVFVITDEDLTIREVEKIHIIDYDDYVSFAWVEFKIGNYDKLVNCLENIYSMTNTDSLYPYPESDSNYYHLIGKKK